MVHIQIFSPQKTLYENDLMYAVFPGQAGEFAIYPDHAPFVSALRQGTIRCVMDGKKEEPIAINGGFVEVNQDKITVCVEQ